MLTNAAAVYEHAVATHAATSANAAATQQDRVAMAESIIFGLGDLPPR
jgi:hypothetical protein